MVVVVRKFYGHVMFYFLTAKCRFILRSIVTNYTSAPMKGLMFCHGPDLSTDSYTQSDFRPFCVAQRIVSYSDSVGIFHSKS